MNTTIDSKTLAAASRLAGKLANNRSSLPILKHVRLQAGTECLAINATDLDSFVMVIAKAHTDTEGQCCVPAKRLTEIAASCKDAVELGRPEADEDTAPLHVLNGSTFSMATLPVDDFPPTPAMEGAQSFVITAADLRKALARVQACQSTDETHYVLNGVCLELTQGSLRAVATDCRRLSYQDVPCGWVPDKPAKDGPVQLIVTSDVAKFLLASLPKGNTSAVMVAFKFYKSAKNEPVTGQVSFMFRSGELGVHLVSKLIEGNYPNYKQVIPDDCKERVTFNRAELLGAIRVMERAATEKCASVKMTLARNNAKFEAGPQESAATSNLVVNYNGKALAIAFSPSYAADTLVALDTDEVIVSLIDELTPLVVTATGEEFKAIIMPFRLS